MSRKYKPAEIWKRKHKGKRVFHSRLAGYLAILSLWVDDREIVLMSVYECRWGPDPNTGLSHQPHLHIGHDWQFRKRWKRRLHRYLIYPARKHLIWRFYGLRSRVRLYRQTGDWNARHAGWHQTPGCARIGMWKRLTRKKSPGGCAAG
jgi:hypothetical protein